MRYPDDGMGCSCCGELDCVGDCELDEGGDLVGYDDDYCDYDEADAPCLDPHACCNPHPYHTADECHFPDVRTGAERARDRRTATALKHLKRRARRRARGWAVKSRPQVARMTRRMAARVDLFTQRDPQGRSLHQLVEEIPW